MSSKPPESYLTQDAIRVARFQRIFWLSVTVLCFLCGFLVDLIDVDWWIRDWVSHLIVFASGIAYSAALIFHSYLVDSQHPLQPTKPIEA